MSNKKYGFTIVELLIVIVVIAILAAISLVAYDGIQERSMRAKIDSDLRNLSTAIKIARESESETLLSVTGSGCSRCSCPYSGGDTTNYSTLPKTSSCWVRYNSTLTAIENASGVTLSGLRDGDPWGAPYSIDENEGESGACGTDALWSFGPESNSNRPGYYPNPIIRIPLSGFSGCA